jgi:asparagine synthase (glutamine-hydrolysing)
MYTTLEHRRPGNAGFFRASGVGLAMRQLSVIDLLTGHQPLGNENGNVQVFFNGEINNYRKLPRHLRQQGHVFMPSSNIQSVVHHYRKCCLKSASRQED